MQRAWTKHGEANFDFSILEVCERSVLLEHEQFHIDALKQDYNSMPKVRVLTPEILAKRANSLRLQASLITECPRGHTYTAQNTLINRGKRVCRRCAADRVEARRSIETDEQKAIRLHSLRQYYQLNHEKMLKQNLEYAAKHREEKREYDRLRRLRLKG